MPPTLLTTLAAIALPAAAPAAQPTEVRMPSTGGSVVVNGQPVRIGDAPAAPGGVTPAGWWDERPPRVGDEAPPLSFETIYDRPDGIPDPTAFEWSQYAGRIVVVDFAASWCNPCRMTVPHMNRLVEDLAEEPVVFITVSNESDEQITRFRDEVGLRSLVARDADGSTFEDYWVNGIPHVAVIDGAGRIAALTHPAHVTADALRDLARGQSIDLPATNENPTRVRWNPPTPGASLAPTGLDDAMFYAVMRRAEARSPSFRTNRTTGELSTEGSPPLTLLIHALRMPLRYVDVRVPLPEDVFYAVAIRPGDGRLETTNAMLLSMLEATLGVRVRHTEEPGEVRVLRVADPSRLPPAFEGTGGGGSMSPGRIAMRGLTFDALASHLTGFTPHPVVDETGLDTRFDVALEYDPRVRGALTEALASIGLELVPAERPVRRAVIEQAVIE